MELAVCTSHAVVQLVNYGVVIIFRVIRIDTEPVHCRLLSMWHGVSQQELPAIWGHEWLWHHLRVGHHIDLDPIDDFTSFRIGRSWDTTSMSPLGTHCVPPPARVDGSVDKSCILAWVIV